MTQQRLVPKLVATALAAARGAGFAVPQPIFEKGIQHLNSVFAAASESSSGDALSESKGLAC